MGRKRGRMIGKECLILELRQRSIVLCFVVFIVCFSFENTHAVGEDWRGGVSLHELVNSSCGLSDVQDTIMIVYSITIVGVGVTDHRCQEQGKSFVLWYCCEQLHDWIVMDHPVFFLVKASTSRVADVVFDSHLCWDICRSSHNSDLKIGTPVATLPAIIGSGLGLVCSQSVNCNVVR